MYPPLLTDNLPQENDGIQLTIQAIITNSIDDLFNRILITMWYLWNARNDTHFQRKSWTPWQVHHAVAAHTATLLALHDSQQPPTEPQPSGMTDRDHRLPPTHTDASPVLPWHVSHNTQGIANSAAGMNQIGHRAQEEINIPTNRPNLQIPALIPGVRCYVDASTAPDHPSLPPRMAGLGIFFVNTQVQPAQMIYIKAQMSGTHSVLMAEAAALALAAVLNDALNFNNTAFLSDCQQLVDFLSLNDHTHPPDWRIKFFTQLFINCSARSHAQIFKISRNLNSTADSLARQALSTTGSTLEPACSYLHHHHQCPLSVALTSVNMQAVNILSASCC